MQLLLSRRVDPRSGVSLVWGRINSGTVANAIPETGTIEGTPERWTTVVGNWPSSWCPSLPSRSWLLPVGIKVSVTDGVPPAINHLRRSPDDPGDDGDAGVVGGDGNRAVPRWRGLFLDAAAAARCARSARGAALGVATCSDLHHPNFTVDEGCIPIGLKVLAELATSEAPASEQNPDVTERGPMYEK